MLGPVVSAQDEFRGFLHDLVSQAMLGGLRGSAGRYHLPARLVSRSWVSRSGVELRQCRYLHGEPQGGDPGGMEARPGRSELASADACAKHLLPGRGMVAADRQPHARRARSLVVAAAETAAAPVAAEVIGVAPTWSASPPARVGQAS